MQHVEVMPIEEVRLLEKCEAVIERGLGNFMEVGRALVQIRDLRLFRGKHGDFMVYCKSRWGIERRHVYNLMAATEVVRGLEPEKCTRVHIAPVMEKQVRPLVSLDSAGQRREAWAAAVEKAGGEQPTPKQVAECVQEIKGEPSPTPKRQAITLGTDLEAAAERIVGFYTPSELRCLVALITRKGLS